MHVTSAATTGFWDEPQTCGDESGTVPWHLGLKCVDVISLCSAPYRQSIRTPSTSRLLALAQVV